MSIGISRDPELYRLLLHAPPTQRLPVLLFAAIHDLLLVDPSEQLARWYPNLTPEPLPAVRPQPAADAATVRRRTPRGDRGAARRPGRHRRTRSAAAPCSFLRSVSWRARSVHSGTSMSAPAADSTCSLDRFQYRYVSPEGDVTVVGASSPVVLSTGTTGHVPIPSTMPTISARCGVDQRPIDVTDPVEARWLEACVWPDQPDRFHRLVAAIELARARPPSCSWATPLPRSHTASTGLAPTPIRW